jgi:hypothetical protein
MAWKALILGLIMLFIFGGILPLILSPFAIEQGDYEGYLSPIINFVQNGLTITIPSLWFAGSDFTFSLNPFSLFGNAQAFILTQLQGYSVIPIIIGLPILIINSILIIYGVVKLFPFG